MVVAGAESAIVQAFTPLCVVRAQEQPEQIALLMEESGSSQRASFVVEAGWVSNVNEDFQTKVARACALAIVEAMETEPTDAAAD